MSIVKKAIKGDKEALVELINANELKLYKVAKAILKNEDDVADALQEALISIYRNIYSLKKEQYFITWITRIVINKCYDVIYKNNVNEKKIIQMGTRDIIEEQIEIEEDLVNKTVLQMALDKLDDDLRVITVLFYYNDLSIKEISQAMDIPTGTVKSRLSRAREKLYEILQSKGGVEENE